MMLVDYNNTTQREYDARRLLQMGYKEHLMPVDYYKENLMLVVYYKSATERI